MFSLRNNYICVLFFLDVASCELMGVKAVITGASYGLGRATAIRFAELGAKIVLVSRNLEELCKTYEAIRQLGVESYVLRCDLGDHIQVETTCKEILKLYGGKIDVLINIASGWITGSLENLSYEDLQEMVVPTVVGTMYFTKLLLPGLRRGRNPRIINVASIDILPHPDPSKSSVPFIAAKHGVAGFSEALREEVREENIRVTTICPGPFYSESTLSQSWEEVVRVFGDDRMPIRDVVESIVFCSTLSPLSNIDTMFIVPFKSH